MGIQHWGSVPDINDLYYHYIILYGYTGRCTLLSCLVLFCLFLSCLVPFWLVMSFIVILMLYPVLYCLTSSRYVQPCTVLPRSVMSIITTSDKSSCIPLSFNTIIMDRLIFCCYVLYVKGPQLYKPDFRVSFGGSYH